MLTFLLRRTGIMLLTAVILTLIVFFLMNLRPNLEILARTELGNLTPQNEVDNWIQTEILSTPLLARYWDWLTGVFTGDWGVSTRFDREVNDVIWQRLGYTGILMFWVMLVMVPLALIVGVLAGMREKSTTDRSLSTLSIVSTSTPEFVMGPILVVLFGASAYGLSPLFKDSGVLLSPIATSATDSGVSFYNFALPVMTMSLYGMGYIARMTRASMAEVMTQQYIRTARLKGVSFRKIVLRHALRNALIAPFTVIMLQFPWLLTGVVVVERLFDYKGFGWVLVEAASNTDIELLLACSVIAVFVVLVTQLISDIGYVFLNPRIRIS